MRRTTTVAFMACLSLLAAAARAEVRTRTVEYKDGDVTLKGYLAYDDAAKGKRPAVLVFPEWWGLNDYPKARAEQLAKAGYVALAADVYGEGKTTRDPGEAGSLAGPFLRDRTALRARAKAAFETLTKQEGVDASKVAAIGYCFGGTASLELARSGAPVAGVVSFHGNLSSPTPADAKNVKGKVLVATGADDPMVPAKDVQAFEDEMRGAKVDYSVISYGNAVHAFTNPNADKANIPGVAYNEAADKRSWRAMMDFFAELFGSAAK